MEKIMTILEKMDALLSEESRETRSLRKIIKTKNKELKLFFDKSYEKWGKKVGKMNKDYEAEIRAAKDTLKHMGTKKMFLYKRGDENDPGYQMGIIELVGGIKGK